MRGRKRPESRGIGGRPCSSWRVISGMTFHGFIVSDVLTGSKDPRNVIVDPRRYARSLSRGKIESQVPLSVRLENVLRGSGFGDCK